MDPKVEDLAGAVPAPPQSPGRGKLQVFLARSPLAAQSREQARNPILLPGEELRRGRSRQRREWCVSSAAH